MVRLIWCTASWLLLSGTLSVGHAQERPADASVSAGDLRGAITRLASLDYPTRMNAARTVRRAQAAEAVGALREAVAGTSDEFVRYRALVLLTSFVDPGTSDLMKSLVTHRNDRVREVAYRWLTLHPEPSFTTAMLTALQTEQAEFVRPALVKALAALGADPQVQRTLVAEAGKGLDLFRVGVIDALGEFKAAYAREVLQGIARIEGPLQDDAVLALGRIGDPRAQDTLDSLAMAPPEVNVAVQAAYCLLDRDCGARVDYIAGVLSAEGARTDAVRSAVTMLTVLAATGVDSAVERLAVLALLPRTRAVASIGLGGVALRSPDRVLTWLASADPDRQTQLVDALRVAFEQFDEDFAEEQFFAATRAAYWRAPEGSSARALMALLIQRLEF